MKVFITGATGFIGHNLARTLLNRGDNVLCLVRPGSDTSRLQNWGVRLVEGDLLKPDNLAGSILDCEIVYHLAGTTKSINYAGYRRGNVETTENLLRVMADAKNGNQKLVYVSSQAAAGPSLSPDFAEEDIAVPVSGYGRSKYDAERLIVKNTKNINFTILRPSIVFGPHDREMLPLFKAACRGIIPHPGFGDFPVNFIYIADLVKAMLLAGTDDRAVGKIYFVHDGQPSSWKSMNKSITQKVNNKAVILPIALRILQLICLLSGISSRIRGKAAYLNQDKWLEIKQGGWLCSAKKINTELGFTAHWTQAQAVSATAEWYKNNTWL